MPFPLQITIRDISNTPGIEANIRKKAERLSLVYKRINSCRIVVTPAQKHKLQGKEFAVSINVTVPGKELAVTRKRHEDLYVTIRNAFSAMYKQLESYARRQRNEVKMHEPIVTGYIGRLFSADGYGFIIGHDGNEYYFDEASVAHPVFSALKIGAGVRFLASLEGDSPQAHRISIHGHNWQKAA